MIRTEMKTSKSNVQSESKKQMCQENVAKQKVFIYAPGCAPAL